MKSILILVILAVVISAAPIPGRYIFVFHPNTTVQQRDAFHSKFLSASVGHKITHDWSFGDFHGFAAETSEKFVRLQRESVGLFRFIEQDQEVHINKVKETPTCQTQSKATWGLNRISEREVALDGNYYYEYDGSSVDSYIIDTGIEISHPEFEGRAYWGANYVDSNNQDCNGHGTHCAGTVGSLTYGVAKKTTLYAVKVLNCAGSGSYAGVISGIQWVAKNAATTKRKSVANMSLGGPLYQAVNDAVDAAVNAGVTFLVAAGNDNNDACKYSPASALYGITVGSTEVQGSGETQRDLRSSFSNFGSCLDIFAPGTQITSTWINGGVRTISGTSMATPHVCGAAAVYFDKYPSATTKDFLAHLNSESGSTKDVINFNCVSTACRNSPNLLLHSACDFGGY